MPNPWLIAFRDKHLHPLSRLTVLAFRLVDRERGLGRVRRGNVLRGVGGGRRLGGGYGARASASACACAGASTSGRTHRLGSVMLAVDAIVFYCFKVDFQLFQSGFVFFARAS
jgi:hypothetical protein